MLYNLLMDNNDDKQTSANDQPINAFEGSTADSSTKHESSKIKLTKNKKLTIIAVAVVVLVGAAATYLLVKPKETAHQQKAQDQSQSTNNAKQASFEPNPIDCKPYDESQWYRTDSTFVVDPKNPETMYVNVEWKGFYKTTDGGKNWTKKTKGIVVDNIDKTTKEPCYTEYPVAVIDPTNPQRLLLATSGGGGGTINDMNMHGGGVYESTDGADSWRQTINTTMNGYVTHALVLDPKNPQTFYYGTAASPASYREADPNKIWVTKGVIYKTSDNGKNWKELPTGIIKDLRLISIVIDPQDSNKLTASGVVMIHSQNGPNGIGKEQIGVIQSLDGGETWKRIDDLPKGYEASLMGAASTNNGNNMFHISAVTGGEQEPKSFYTTDGGHHWKQSSKNFDFITYDPYDKSGNTLIGYAWQCTSGPCLKQLYRSADAGATWVPFGALPNEIASLQDHKTMISNIVFHPSDKNTLFLTGANGYVWKSVDGGTSWNTILSLDKIK